MDLQTSETNKPANKTTDEPAGKTIDEPIKSASTTIEPPKESDLQTSETIKPVSTTIEPPKESDLQTSETIKPASTTIDEPPKKSELQTSVTRKDRIDSSVSKHYLARLLKKFDDHSLSFITRFGINSSKYFAMIRATIPDWFGNISKTVNKLTNLWTTFSSSISGEEGFVKKWKEYINQFEFGKFLLTNTKSVYKIIFNFAWKMLYLSFFGSTKIDVEDTLSAKSY